MTNPFDPLAQPKPGRAKPRPKRARQRTWPDRLERQRSLSEILDEKCSGDDPSDDLYWGNKDY
jgi:hypothetical protein